MDSKTIMIVDDDTLMQSVIKDYLEPSGFHCTCADSLAEARTLFSELDPDLVVLDIEFPKAFGTAFLKSIKRWIASEHTATPVIVTSGRHNKDIVSHAFDCGADAFIPKPFDPEDLVYFVKAFTQ